MKLPGSISRNEKKDPLDAFIPTEHIKKTEIDISALHKFFDRRISKLLNCEKFRQGTHVQISRFNIALLFATVCRKPAIRSPLLTTLQLVLQMQTAVILALYWQRKYRKDTTGCFTNFTASKSATPSF